MYIYDQAKSREVDFNVHVLQGEETAAQRKEMTQMGKAWRNIQGPAMDWQVGIY